MSNILNVLKEKEQSLERFWISLVGILIIDNKCLIMEFANMPGFWDIPGGRIEDGEDYQIAFKRELKEELGLSGVIIVDVVDYDIWYTQKRKIPVCAIVSLIKTENMDIKISHEHLSYKWITEDEVDDYKYFWPNAARMIKKGFKKYKELN